MREISRRVRGEWISFLALSFGKRKRKKVKTFPFFFLSFSFLGTNECTQKYNNVHASYYYDTLVAGASSIDNNTLQFCKLEMKNDGPKRTEEEKSIGSLSRIISLKEPDQISL